MLWASFRHNKSWLKIAFIFFLPIRSFYEHLFQAEWTPKYIPSPYSCLQFGFILAIICYSFLAIICYSFYKFHSFEHPELYKFLTVFFWTIMLYLRLNFLGPELTSKYQVKSNARSSAYRSKFGMVYN